MYQKYLNRYEAYYRHEYLTEFAEELGVTVAAARDFIMRAELPRLPLQRSTYIHDRPQWERDVVRAGISKIVKVSDKHGPLTFEQVSNALDHLNARGVA